MATFPLTTTSRFLSKADGTPFHYIADTPWLTPKLTQAEVVQLVADRKAKGFTTLQISILTVKTNEFTTANAYGDEPFVGAGGTWDLSQPLLVGAATSDDTSPDYDYWDHIDFIVDHLASQGMLAVLVPCWYGPQGRDWRGYLTDTNAAGYGTFLGSRYGSIGNVAWLQGGDNGPGTGVDTNQVPVGLDTSDKVNATRLLARAIIASSAAVPLQTYHMDRTESPYEHFGLDDWYNVHAAYSDEFTYDRCIQEYGQARILPVVMVESHYDARNTEPILDDQRLRAEMYWSATTGAAGFSYGCEGIWNMTEFPAFLSRNSSDDMKRLADLLNSLPGNLLRPDNRFGSHGKMLTSGYGDKLTNGGLDFATSAIAQDRSHGLCYFPNTSAVGVIVNLAAFNKEAVALSWYNPADGSGVAIGTYVGTGTQAVSFPAGWVDAALVAETSGADVVPPPAEARTDTFSGISTAAWTPYAEVADATFSRTVAEQLSIAVSTTATHDLNQSLQSAPMYFQEHDGDFDVTILVDSTVNGAGTGVLRGAGIVVCDDPTGNHVRLATFDNSSLTQRIVFASRLSGVAANYYNNSPGGIPQPLSLRLVRTGNVFKAYRGNSAGNPASMVQVSVNTTIALGATKLGVFALSTGAPQEALINSFVVAGDAEEVPPPPPAGGITVTVWDGTTELVATVGIWNGSTVSEIGSLEIT